MDKEIKKIRINHHTEGDITIHNGLNDDINDLIGDKVSDYSYTKPHYHAIVTENEDGSFNITNLSVVKTDEVNVGFKKTRSGAKNFITIFKNIHIVESMKLYPLGVIYIQYI